MKEYHDTTKTTNERINIWVQREFHPQYVNQVATELLNVATGNWTGNQWDLETLRRIFPEWYLKNTIHKYFDGDIPDDLIHEEDIRNIYDWTGGMFAPETIEDAIEIEQNSLTDES